MKFNLHLVALLIVISLSVPGKALFADGDPAMKDIDLRSYHLGGIASWSEVVSIGIKKMALSSAMSAQELDALLDAAQGIATSAEVSTYRENDFLVTDLFPLSATQGKQVLIIYSGNTLDEYLALKKRKEELLGAGTYDVAARKEIALALGQLLSYPPARINQLLRRN